MNTSEQPRATPDRRFIVGIDLGTTNSAVAYVDATVPTKKIRLFEVPQLTGAGEFRSLAVLPSFLYIPGAYDIDPAALVHPWRKPDDFFAGALARDQGAQVPARLVSSAKSWLCHGNVDRQARILPWGAPAEVRKISPVQAGAAYLDHIRRAWNQARGGEEELFLENQELIITVPASFDEVARELTLAAARQAGLGHVTLLEEPLAVFYNWLMRHEDRWADHVAPGELILICDVGGGTTDFTLVSLNAVEGGSPRFERIAVGDHLILGGDNIDLALARQVESRLRGQGRPNLDVNRWKALTHQCRQAKERILSGQTERDRITLMGTGSRLIAGTVTAELTRAAVEQTLLDGFFPLIEADAPPAPAQRAAIAEFGLPYEPDPAITRHLYRFLERHRQDVADVIGKAGPRPDLVLFNGGALKPHIIQERILEGICRWYGCSAADRPRLLENPSHDLAVALGAAYYGLVKIGRGVRVGSGSPRSYYLAVAAEEGRREPQQAICLVERGLDEGSAIELGERTFEVLTNQPVRFDLFSSSFRSRDRIGQLVAIDATFMPLPPLQTVIQFGKKGLQTTLPVRMEAEYTELGTLALWCRSLVSGHRWRLQFQLRDAAAPLEVREEIVLEDERIGAAREAVQSAFSGADSAALPGVIKQVSALVDRPREQWPLGLIRELADTLLANGAARALSAEHEARWMNLTGFCLRPGFGDFLDPERIKKVWRIFSQGPVRPNQAQVQSEWWIMWRRLAGGLSPGQQRQLSQTLGPLLQGKKGKKALRLPLQRQLEMWMAVANLERLYVKDKIQWGRLLLAQLDPGQVRHQLLWCLARIGARELLYGPADRVIPPEEASQWIGLLLSRSWSDPRPVGAALAQLARKTGDRTRDVAPAVVARIVQWMDGREEFSEQRRYLEQVVPMARQEEQALFGESLPSGIILRQTAAQT